MPDATTDSNKPTTTTGARMASDQADSLMRLATYASVTVAVVQAMARVQRKPMRL